MGEENEHAKSCGDMTTRKGVAVCYARVEASNNVAPDVSSLRLSTTRGRRCAGFVFEKYERVNRNLEYYSLTRGHETMGVYSSRRVRNGALIYAGDRPPSLRSRMLCTGVEGNLCLCLLGTKTGPVFTLRAGTPADLLPLMAS